MTEESQEKSTFKQIVSHDYFPNFVMYSIGLILLGGANNCLGPLIPYLASHEDRQQTQYSNLFTAKAIGFLISAIALRILGNKVSNKQLIITGLVVIALFFILFDYVSNEFVRNVCMFMTAIGGCFFEVGINLSILIAFKGDNMAKWMQTMHGFYGIGGLIVAFFVYIFQLKTFTVIGAFSVLLIGLNWLLKNPEQQSSNQHENIDEEAPPTHPFPIGLLILFSLLGLIIGGFQAAFGGWVSSYAVLNDFATKEHATLYPSIFWISATAFRFLFAFLPGDSSTKIRNLAITGILTTFVSILLIFKVDHEFGIISMSLLYGLGYSIMIPSLYMIPDEFGFNLTVNQMSVFGVIASFAGYLAVFTGKMMDWVSYSWFMYSICLMNFVLAVLVILIQIFFAQDKQKKLSMDYVKTSSVLAETKEISQQVESKNEQRHLNTCDL